MRLGAGKTTFVSVFLCTTRVATLSEYTCSQVSLTQNLAPTSGKLQVLPTHGNVLDTIFQLSAEQWVDPKVPAEDYPLVFSFGYIDSSGFPKLFSSGSLLSSISTMFPSGSDAVGCQATESLCRRLQVTVSVSDALFAWSEPSVPTYVRVDNMDPFKMQEIIEREMVFVQTLEDSMSGSDLMTKCTTIADSMNDGTVNFEFYGIGISEKTAWRDQMIVHLDLTVHTLLAPLTVQAVLQALGAVSAIVGADLELSAFCVNLALSLIQDLTSMLLDMARTGNLIPGMSSILRHMRVSLGQAAAASSRLSSQVRRYSIHPDSFRHSKTQASGFLHPGVGASRRSLPGQNGMDVIRSVNGLSKLSVASHAAGQQTAAQETAKFKVKTDRIELDMLSGFGDTILGAPISRCADCAEIVPEFTYTFPTNSDVRRLSQVSAASYEVESALIYDMILPESRTTLQCIVKGDQVSWSSDPVLVPIDVSGNTIFQKIRMDVDRFGFVNCPLLSAVGLLVVRELHTDANVLQLDATSAVSIRLSFDPTVREEITAMSVDPFTGISSSASCVRWDEDLRLWTPEGIQHISVYLGAPNGTGAYVECKTLMLGTFAVSEVIPVYICGIDSELMVGAVC